VGLHHPPNSGFSHLDQPLIAGNEIQAGIETEAVDSTRHRARHHWSSSRVARFFTSTPAQKTKISQSQRIKSTDRQHGDVVRGKCIADEGANRVDDGFDDFSAGGTVSGAPILQTESAATS
jgi:hypothetical protein